MAEPLDPRALLAHVKDLPIADFAPGSVIVAAGTASGKLMVLRAGRVEVSIEGVVLGTLEAAGSVIGEIAALLGRAHTADVRALEPSSVHVADAAGALAGNPFLARHIAAVLAQRLDLVNHRLVELRRELDAHAPKSILDESVDYLAKVALLGAFA